MTTDGTDVLIVGAGPAGLYAAFYVGLRGLHATIIDARHEPGGQLTTLYPEKYVYDAPGFPKIRAAELVERLVRQAATFQPTYHLGEVANGLQREGDRWHLHTTRGTHTAPAVILTAGIGALLPRPATIPGEANSHRVHTELTDPHQHHGQHVLVYGGVPQATTWALALHEAGAHVTLAHRRALFRGTPEQLARLEQLREAGQLTVHAPAVLERVTANTAVLSTGHETLEVPLDALYHAGGYLPDLGPIQQLGVTMHGDYITSGPGQTTSHPGVFVAGDLASEGGDMKLIAGAFAQAATAANQAVHHARPDLKVRPGHSSDKRVPV